MEDKPASTEDEEAGEFGGSDEGDNGTSDEYHTESDAAEDEDDWEDIDVNVEGVNLDNDTGTEDSEKMVRKKGKGKQTTRDKKKKGKGKVTYVALILHDLTLTLLRKGRPGPSCEAWAT